MTVSPDLIHFIGQKRRSEKSQINEFLIRRDINDLFHFTKISNLSNIINHGLRSRDLLEGIEYQVSDLERIDKNYWGVSLSLTQPNSFMMRNKIKYAEKKDYVVLRYSAKILQELDFIAFPGNASDRRIISYFEDNPFNLGGIVGLQRMFLSPENRKILSLRDCETTDAQAEIMFIEPIPWSDYFTGIYLHEYYSRDIFDSQSIEPNLNTETIFRCYGFDNNFFLDTRGAFSSYTQTRFNTKFNVDWI